MYTDEHMNSACSNNVAPSWNEKVQQGMIIEWYGPGSIEANIATPTLQLFKINTTEKETNL